MLCKVDWLSFTFQGDTGRDPKPGEEWKTALRGLSHANVGLRKFLDAEAKWEDGGGRAPFKKSIRALNVGVSIFYGHKSNLCLCEISGVGCHRLYEINGMNYTLKKIGERLTRLDIACDWSTDVTPRDFASMRDNERFKTYSEMTSQSGDTCYVGSRTSDRYARVYRYNAPHPRSGLLRCEMVVKDDQAKESAAYIVEFGEVKASRAIGHAFGWKHDLWNEYAQEDVAPLEYRSFERGGNTVRWLYKQVGRSVERMLEEGKRDEIETWLAYITALVYTGDTQSETTSNE